MIVKLFGFADLLAVIALLAASILPKELVIIMALYLIIKGVFFTITGGSYLPNLFDVFSGFYLVSAAFGFSHWILNVIVVIFLLQKAFVSLV